MSDGFKDWLAIELKQRGWSHRELARRANVSQPLVSRTLSGETSPSHDFCIKAAAALDVPPEKVLRLAGILPPSDDSAIQESIDLLRNLPHTQRKQALEYLRFLYTRRDE